MSLPIFFAHGNGFPSDTYQRFFHHLGPKFHIHRLAMSGHQSAYPVSDNWPHLVAEVIDAVKATGQTPLIGMGHSMGGVLIFMAACQAPHLFHTIVLLDAPILGRGRSLLLKLSKRLNLLDYVLPVPHNGQRRHQFATKTEAYAYFRSKAVFQYFSDESLWAYVDAGLSARADGSFCLRFQRDIESAIYHSAPDNLYRLRLASTINPHLLYNPHGKIVSQADRRFMKRLGFQVQPIHQGSHLFPLEVPELTALHLKPWLVSTPH